MNTTKEMTDKEKLTALLKELGIGFKDEGKSLKCETGMDKVSGYTFFWTEFQFDDDGKFIHMGAWE